jgi:hypothetical protein
MLDQQIDSIERLHRQGSIVEAATDFVKAALQRGEKEPEISQIQILGRHRPGL